MAKYLVFIACLVALGQANALELNSEGKIKITAVTTAGCSDTVTFIQDLTQAYALYSQFLDLEFIPWGRSVWDGVGAITCQFSAPDCWANRVHRCVLNMLRGDQARQMHYMTCEFTRPRPAFDQGTYLCASAVGVNLINLDHCVANRYDELDRAAQAAAQTPMAVINFVPAIVFNDVSNVALHNEARSRLISMICFALAANPSTGVTNCQI